MLLQIVPAWSYVWDLLKMSCAALKTYYVDLYVSQGISVLCPCNHLFTSDAVKGVDIVVIVTRFELGLPSYVISLRQPTPTPDSLSVAIKRNRGSRSAVRSKYNKLCFSI